MPKIFLVEDDSTMLSLLETLLQMEGYQVVTSGDLEIEDEFARIQQEKPSLVLIDVNLRRFSGFDLLTRIQEDESLGDARVVMSSGMDYTERCLEEGADAFLLKPYMPDDLIQMIRQTLSLERDRE